MIVAFRRLRLSAHKMASEPYGPKPKTKEITMKRRSGLTLVEVLVAMFIMSIGMIALLTLFPIGVLRMAQSIRDARCEQMGRNAYATAVMENVGADVDVITGSAAALTAAIDNTGIQIPDVFRNPSPKLLSGAANLPDADDYAESYPILVDPIAYNQIGGSQHDWVGGTPDVLRRRSVEFLRRGGVTSAVLTVNTFRSFSLWDELRFNSSVSPPALVPPATPQKAFAVGPIFRDPRFTSAYVLRRPQTADKSLVDCTVVVYENRTVYPLEEYVNVGNTFYNPTNNTIAIDYTATVLPELRPGDWIMDTTFYLTSPPAAAVPKGSARAFFYRIVAIEDFILSGRKIRRFEVQSPLRGVKLGAPSDDPILGAQGTSIIMVGVTEVFEKGLLRLP